MPATQGCLKVHLMANHNDRRLAGLLIGLTSIRNADLGTVAPLEAGVSPRAQPPTTPQNSASASAESCAVRVMVSLLANVTGDKVRLFARVSVYVCLWGCVLCMCVCVFVCLCVCVCVLSPCAMSAQTLQCRRQRLRGV